MDRYDTFFSVRGRVNNNITIMPTTDQTIVHVAWPVIVLNAIAQVRT